MENFPNKCKLNVFFSSVVAGHIVNSQSRRSPTIARSLGVNPKSVVSTSVQDSFVCPEEFGYYPHPHDCSQYYVCVFGGALLESCTGGLMYSHELQTCDWPRNVGCEVAEESVTSGRDAVSHEPNIYQVVPNKFRFSSLQSTSPAPERSSELASVRHPVSLQSQQTIPPPPELRIPPNPVITSRGQPKPLENLDIAKVTSLNFILNFVQSIM